MRELGKLEGLRWMRILYAYPSYFTEELVEEIATNPKVRERGDEGQRGGGRRGGAGSPKSGGRGKGGGGRGEGKALQHMGPSFPPHMAPPSPPPLRCASTWTCLYSTSAT